MNLPNQGYSSDSSHVQRALETNLGDQSFGWVNSSPQDEVALPQQAVNTRVCDRCILSVLSIPDLRLDQLS